MRQLITTTILLSILWSCNSQAKKEKAIEHDQLTEQTNSEFENYISTLDKIPLPLETNPRGQLPVISKNFDKTKFEKFKHTWTSQPLGIYYRDEKIIAIIDCSMGDWGLIPFLTTYDLKGNKIDSTGFYDKSGQDMGYEAIEYLTFKPDRRISMLDTVKRWVFNEDETDIIEGSMRMTTGKVEYRILDNGRIEKK